MTKSIRRGAGEFLLLSSAFHSVQPHFQPLLHQTDKIQGFSANQFKDVFFFINKMLI